MTKGYHGSKTATPIRDLFQTPQSGNNKGSVVFVFGLHNTQTVTLLDRKDMEVSYGM